MTRTPRRSRLATSASHPADALALASVELRRMLTNHDWPADQTRWPRGRVERAVADAHAAVDTETAASLRWALAELDRTRDELHAQRAGAALHVRARSGDAAAREQLRVQNRARLDAAGVTASSREWDTDGFGRAEDVDLALPCLALATTVREVEDLDGLHFKQIRRWHALQHRTAPRPLSRYRTAVVTPLQLNPAADLALRRTAPRVPTGRSVGAYRSFHDLLATELPGIDVSGITDELSPAWLPLPISTVAQLCAGTEDADVDLENLSERTDAKHPWLFGPTWVLAYITEHLGEGDW